MAITTQKRTPLPKGTSRDCQVAPVQVTTLGGQCHHQTLGQGIPLLQPHVVTVKTRICCEPCLETQHWTSQGKSKAEEGAWPAWGSSAAGWRVPGNTQGIQGKWLPAMEGVCLVVLPTDLDGAEWWTTGSLVQTHSKPSWCCQRGIMRSVGRTKGCTRKFKKPSVQWAADQLLFSPSGAPWLATRLINKLINQPKSKQELLGPSRGFLVFQCLNKHVFIVKNKMDHQGFMLPSPQGTYWSTTESQRKQLCMKTIMDIFSPDNTLYILETTKTARWEYTMLSEAQIKDTHISQWKKTFAHPPNFPCFCWKGGLFMTRSQAVQSPSSLFSVGVKEDKEKLCQ